MIEPNGGQKIKLICPSALTYAPVHAADRVETCRYAGVGTFVQRGDG